MSSHEEAEEELTEGPFPALCRESSGLLRLGCDTKEQEALPLTCVILSLRRWQPMAGSYGTPSPTHLGHRAAHSWTLISRLR